MGPVFLDIEDVLCIHANQIQHYGGSAEIRDKGLLESAISMPKASFGGRFAHENIFEMAAAYLLSVDGIKTLAFRRNLEDLMVLVIIWLWKTTEHQAIADTT